MVKQFSISGPIPSKKNSKRIVRTRDRMFLMSSHNHGQWHRTALVELKIAHRSNETIKKVTSIVAVFFAPDRRVFDLSNKFESVADLLVDGGVLEDDNYIVMPEITLRYGGMDKENPRCDITLTLPE